MKLLKEGGKRKVERRSWKNGARGEEERMRGKRENGKKRKREKRRNEKMEKRGEKLSFIPHSS